MPKPPRLDLRRLERDVTTATARSVGLAPGGRPATGLMAVVRDNLDALVAMQAGGVTWNAIAAALTKQGYATADGRDLTGGQITGIVSSVRRQAKRRAAKAATRQGRPDLPVLVPERGPDRRLGLAADLVPPTPSLGLAPDLIPRETADTEPDHPSAEDIRHSALAAVQKLLKKDLP